MTLDQFKQALVDMGYKHKYNDVRSGYMHTSYTKRSKTINIQEWDDYTNLFYDKDFKNGSYEYNQHRVTNYKQALNNIKRYERKLGL